MHEHVHEYIVLILVSVSYLFWLVRRTCFG